MPEASKSRSLLRFFSGLVPAVVTDTISVAPCPVMPQSTAEALLSQYSSGPATSLALEPLMPVEESTMPSDLCEEQKRQTNKHFLAASAAALLQTSALLTL